MPHQDDIQAGAAPVRPATRPVPGRPGAGHRL